MGRRDIRFTAVTRINAAGPDVRSSGDEWLPATRLRRPQEGESHDEQRGSPTLAGVGPRLPAARESLAGEARSRSRAPSGLVLALFMWGHMAFVSSILLGKDAMWTITQVLRGLFLFRPLLSRGSSRWWLQSIIALFVAHALLAVRKFPINYRQFATFRGHMRMMRHEDTTLWFWQVAHRFRIVLSRVGAPLHHADPARPHRPVRIRRPGLERSLLAALHRAAARRSRCTAGSASTASR